MSSEIRQKKVESLLQRLVSEMIQKGTIKDPRIDSLIIVSDVKVSSDLSSARVALSSFSGEKNAERSMDALNHAAGFIQRTLAPKLKMRKIPHLHFVLDHSLKEGMELNRRMETLFQDEKSGQGE